MAEIKDQQGAPKRRAMNLTFGSMGMGHQFDKDWKDDKETEWMQTIEAELLKNRHAIMTRQYKGDPLMLEVVGSHQKRVILNPTAGGDVSMIVSNGLPQDDPTLRAFAGVGRIGDDVLASYPQASSWVNRWSAAASGAAMCVGNMVINGGVSWASKLSKIAAVSAAVETARSAVQNITRDMPEYAARAANITNSSANETFDFGSGQILNQTDALRSVQSTMANMAKENQTYSELIANGTRTVANLTNPSDWIEGVYKVVPSAAVMLQVGDTAVRAITAPLAHVPFLHPVGLATAGTFVIGMLGYYGVSWYARRQAVEWSRSSAQETFRNVARQVAKQVMREVVSDNNDIRAEEIAESKLELDSLMRMQLEHSKTIADEFTRKRKLQDEALLQQLAAGYARMGVTPFQLVWYVADSMVRNLLNVESCKTFLVLFSNANSALATYVRSNLEEAKTRMQAVNVGNQSVASAQGEEAAKRLMDEATKNLQDAQKMFDTVEKLRRKGWNEAEVKGEDWNYWLNGLMVDGLNRIESEVKAYFTDVTRGYRLNAAVVDLPDTRNERVVNAMLTDSAFTTNVEVENEGCIVIGERNNTLVRGQEDMWFELDQKARPDRRGGDETTRNFDRANEIFDRMLMKTKWDVPNDPIFNSYQRLWLYRWMGPACTRWLSVADDKREFKVEPRRGYESELQGIVIEGGERKFIVQTDRERALTFVSETCRRRFAFLKSMMYHSLLFLFVRPNEAVEMLNGKKPDSCITADLFGGSGIGRGLLLLDNCRPGVARIVGKNISGHMVNEAVDVAKLVTIEDGKDAGSWTFNHKRILYNILQKAYTDHGIELMSNYCWKAVSSRTKKYELGDKKYIDTEAPRGDHKEDLSAFGSVMYLYNLSRSSALRSRLTLYKDAVKKVGLRYFYTTSKTLPVDAYVDERLKNIRLVNDQLVEDMERQNAHGISFTTVVDARIEAVRAAMGGGANLPDVGFRELATKLHVYSDTEVSEYEDRTKLIIGDRNQWAELFESSGFSRCNVHWEPVVINTLCVNPFAICVYEKKVVGIADRQAGGRVPTDAYLIFGDAWFLQPIMVSLQKTTLAFKVKRFTAVQDWFGKDLESSRKRKFLQDALYTHKWHSMVGIRSQ